MQGFQYFSILPVPHYLQAVLFINILKKIMNISNNFETFLNQEVPKTILDGKSTWYNPLLKCLTSILWKLITRILWKKIWSKNLDIKFSTHNLSLGWPSPGTLKVNLWQQ